MEGLNLHHGVVSRAAAQSTSTRVQDSQRVRVGGRVGTDVKLARRGLVGHLGILLLTTQVLVVVDEIVPFCSLVLGGLQLQCRGLDYRRIELVISGIEEQDFVTSDCESGCQWTTSGARANHDIIVFNVRSAGRLSGVRALVQPFVARSMGPMGTFSYTMMARGCSILGLLTKPGPPKEGKGN